MRRPWVPGAPVDWKRGYCKVSTVIENRPNGHDRYVPLQKPVSPFCRPPLTGNGNPVDCPTIECREYRRPLVSRGKRGKKNKQSFVDCVNPIVSHPLIDPC